MSAPTMAGVLHGVGSGEILRGAGAAIGGRQIEVDLVA
jgi:hypothetical protein